MEPSTISQTSKPNTNSGPKPDGDGLADLPTFANPLPFKRNIRRAELRAIVPLGNTTIYEMEQRGEFPKRFYLTARCAVWDLDEVEAWVLERRRSSEAGMLEKAPMPDVHRRRTRPVRP